MNIIVATLLVIGMLVGYSFAQLTLERPVCKPQLTATMGIRG